MLDELVELFFNSKEQILLHNGPVDFLESDWFCEVPGKFHAGLGNLRPSGLYAFVASPKHNETIILQYNPIGKELFPGVYLEDCFTSEILSRFEVMESSYMPHKLGFRKTKEVPFTYQDIKGALMLENTID